MIQMDNAVERYGKLILNELKEANINCWIAGGSLRDYFSGKTTKTDHDLFFPNQLEYDKTANYFKDKEATIKWESDNGMKLVYKGKTFDLIKKFFQNPTETINAFDFTVSMFAIDKDKVYYGETSFIDLAKRQLMINKITYPASTLSRAFRYKGKGFNICLGEMKKLIEAIQSMPKEEKTENENNQSNDEESSSDAMFSGID